MKLLIRLLFLIIISLIFTNIGKSNSFIIGNNANGNVGDTINAQLFLIMNNNVQTNHNIDCSFELSNNLVFYPTECRIGLDTQKLKLIKINDTVYNISGTFQSFEDTISIELEGILLAGNDSICYLNFFSTKVNEDVLNDLTLLIHSNNIGAKFPYIRFAKLQQNAPNPVFVGNYTKWAYTIDIAQEVTFGIYNLNGKELILEKKYIQSAGTHFYELFIGNDFSAGIYYFFLTTENSKVGKFFVVIK